MNKKLLFLILPFICFTVSTIAQQKPPFYDDIQTIRHYDKIYAPPVHPVLFIGSSTIRLWADLPYKFHNPAILNRGFGGARIKDLLNYVDDIVIPYQPSKVIIYIGDNDLSDASLTADSVFNQTKRLHSLIRSKLPEARIIYLAIKPSPSREKYIEKAKAVNRLMADYLAVQGDTFVDTFSIMLDGSGNIKANLFRADKLHMNSDGYKLWEHALKKYVK